jgi:hypothetical protein
VNALDEAAEVSRQIIERELSGARSADQVAKGLEATFARLQGLLGNLIGHAGFRALLARVQHSTAPECDFPEMSSSHEVGPYAVADLALLVERRGVDGAAVCAETLLAHLFRLLSSFIGPDLTFRLVRSVWADLGSEKPGPGSEEA